MPTYRPNNGRHENGQNYLVNDATIRKVVEIDPDYVRWLEQRLDPAVHIVGNLPFHLTTAMPRCVLHARDQADPGPRVAATSARRDFGGRDVWDVQDALREAGVPDAAPPMELDATQRGSLFTTLCGRGPRMRID